MEQPLPPGSSVTGIVVRSTGSWIDVQAGKQLVQSRIRGRFRLRDQSATNPVAVGDLVTVRLNNDDTGVITAIHERRNTLVRRAAGRRVGQEHVLASNIDVVWIVQAVRLPKPNARFIDRVLVSTEAQDIGAGIVFNKIDLAEDGDSGVASLSGLYQELGYDVLHTSAIRGDGVEAFRATLSGRTSVVMGPSGVGKSTLLNSVEPGLGLRAGEVSTKTRKGTHTTAHARLVALSSGGFVVDTPGIREFGVLDLEPWELSHHFPEFRPYLHSCRFPACTHHHEPGCAVKEAYLDDDISDARYYSYLNILHAIHMGEADVGR